MAETSGDRCRDAAAMPAVSYYALSDGADRLALWQCADNTALFLPLITCCVNNASHYHGSVLRSFRDKDTQAVWRRRRSRRLDGPVQRVAWRKLAMLDAAETLTDLLIPPGNRLEKLTGDRAGQYGIRINQQWRICFTRSDAGPEDAEIVDYH